MNHQNKLFVNTIIYSGLLIAAGTSALAESLPDPTRPYNAVTPQAKQTTSPVLQLVIITPTSRVAIISGKRVELGDVYDGAKLVHIEVNKAVFKGVNGLKTMAMFPGIDKNKITIKKQPSSRAIDIYHPNKQGQLSIK